jgi:photosystem II stability/assembly factor-like uncharacterized protein
MTPSVKLYAGTAGHSAWFSGDQGDTWTHPNSHSGMYTEARVWALQSHPAEPDVLYAGSDLGVFRWNESSARWTHLESPMQDVWAIALDPDDPRVIYAGTRPAAFYRSRDAGTTWERLDAPELKPYSEVNRGPTRVTQILFDPVTRGTLWATVEIGGIFRSENGGRSWKYLVNGLVSADVHGIAVVKKPDGGKSVLATTNKGLHRSEDNGETWSFHKLDSPWQYTRAIVPSADGQTLWLTNGNGPPGSTGVLLRSRDTGLTWQEVPLPGRLNSTVWCIAVHPADPQLVFVCTNLGQVFRSRDAGETWTRLEREFGEVRALHWRPSEVTSGQHAVWSYK